ncbi:MAG: hypothetical protein IPJ85_13190 [Flavobacteriales bacterium]|nr:hypothetical protein [Flavobacteriales bacterium]
MTTKTAGHFHAEFTQALDHLPEASVLATYGRDVAQFNFVEPFEVGAVPVMRSMCTLEGVVLPIRCPEGWVFFLDST